jgi:hypothetical protein
LEESAYGALNTKYYLPCSKLAFGFEVFFAAWNRHFGVLVCWSYDGSFFCYSIIFIAAWESMSSQLRKGTGLPNYKTWNKYARFLKCHICILMLFGRRKQENIYIM